MVFSKLRLFWLLPDEIFFNMIVFRYGIFSSFLDRIENQCGGLDHFTRSYETFGMVVQPDNSVRCREWAPGADGLFLIGDFSMKHFFSFSCHCRLKCIKTTGTVIHMPTKKENTVNGN